MGIFYLLDVASGPIIIMVGLLALLVMVAVGVIIYFTVKAIIKIKQERDITNDGS